MVGKLHFHDQINDGVPSMLEKFQINSERLSKISKQVLLFFVILTILIIGVSVPYGVFAKKYQNRILPNTRIGSLNLGGLTIEQGKNKLDSFIDNVNENGITLELDDKKATLYPIFSSFDGGVAKSIISFEVDKNLEKAFSYGHAENLFSRIKQAAGSSFGDMNFPLTTIIDEKETQDFLREEFSQFEKKSIDAKINITFKDGLPEIKIEEGSNGEELDYAKIINRLRDNLGSLNINKITLTLETKTPTINHPDTAIVEASVNDLLKKLPVTLKYQAKEWLISPNEATTFLVLTKDENGKIVAQADTVKIKNYLQTKISTQIDIEPHNSKFLMVNGKMQEFQGSRDGLKLDTEKNAQTIVAAFNGTGTSTIELATEKLLAITSDNIDSMGINDLLGTGKSNFQGSPNNRRHNIRIGAAAVNGTLIAPGSTFSLLKTLGSVDAKNGYLPELVIKDNKTVPEYGGGLCQVGTTVFRGATETGLPIVERRNHSYRVSYYEPAGTDATIYDPAPDFKFKNDTKNYILIQSKIEGNNLAFEFWGTADGRKVEKTYPTIYNIVKPGPTKIIESDKLKPGEKKCTEKAHNGADAFFDYKVTYPSYFSTSTEPIIKETRFRSHYVPWREVCLVGKETTTPTAPIENKDQATLPIVTPKPSTGSTTVITQ